MKKFLTYILLAISLQLNATDICTNYIKSVVKSTPSITGGTVVVDTINTCDFSLTATPISNYKFAYWTNYLGEKNYNNTIDVSIDTELQNVLWSASFVNDNSYIHTWLSDSLIIRTKTTDVLSNSSSIGFAETCVDNDSIDITNKQIRKRDHGIWVKRISELTEGNKYASKQLHMILHNPCGRISGVIDTIIPVIVNGDSLTSNIHTLSSDVQVLENACLTIDRNTTITGFLDIHEGGKVIINENTTLTTNGIILRGNGITQKWAQILVKGNVINNNNDTIYYDYTLDDTQYYPLSLPNDLSQSLIISSSSYTSYLYNTETRNTHNSGWVISSAPYVMGNGYIMWSDPNPWNDKVQTSNTIRYPIHIDLSDEQISKTVDICGGESEIESDRNWNLIGNPYLSNYTIGVGSNVIEVVGGEEEPINYITYSEDGYRTYMQIEAIGFVLKPFNSYFIQTNGNGFIEFERDLQYLHAPKRVHKVHNINKIRTGITLTQGNRTEHIGLLYGDYTDKYEINADLTKMFGSVNVMYAYSLSQDDKLAFQAVSIDSIYPIPVGYKNASNKQMTFAFDNERYECNGIQGLWLYDSKLNKHINLLFDNYTFTPSSSNEDNRFYITAEFNEIDIPTNIENTNTNDSYVVFDVLGRRISDVHTSGVYIIFNKRKYTKVMK